MYISCKKEYERTRLTMSEVVMKNINLTMDTFIHRRWKLPILVFMLLVLGVSFTPADCVAQAVPPRSQTLQMIRPLVRPPQPPVEKEIRDLKGETAELEEQVGVLLPEKNRLFPQVIGRARYVPPSGRGARYVPPSGRGAQYVPPSGAKFVPPSGTR
jgi:hypothetical protein